MPVRILLMDIDDTLFDFQTGYKRALRAALAQFGVECTPQLLELYGSINDRLWERFERGEISREEVLIERFSLLFQAVGMWWTSRGWKVRVNGCLCFLSVRDGV